MKKICTKCGNEKEKENFPRNERTKDGRSTVCKSCLKEYNKKYQKTDWVKQFVIG